MANSSIARSMSIAIPQCAAPHTASGCGAYAVSEVSACWRDWSDRKKPSAGRKAITQTTPPDQTPRQVSVFGFHAASARHAGCGTADKARLDSKGSQPLAGDRTHEQRLAPPESRYPGAARGSERHTIRNNSWPGKTARNGFLAASPSGIEPSFPGGSASRDSRLK
jgi:hypothetical protein